MVLMTVPDTTDADTLADLVRTMAEDIERGERMGYASLVREEGDGGCTVTHTVGWAIVPQPFP